MSNHQFSGGPASGLVIDYDFSRPSTDVPTVTRYPNRISFTYDTVKHPANAEFEPDSPMAVGREKMQATYELDEETGDYVFAGWSLSPNPPDSIDV